MLHYRALFDELIDDRIGNDVEVNAVPRANEVATTPRRDVLRDRDDLGVR